MVQLDSYTGSRELWEPLAWLSAVVHRYDGRWLMCAHNVPHPPRQSVPFLHWSGPSPGCLQLRTTTADIPDDSDFRKECAVGALFHTVDASRSGAGEAGTTIRRWSRHEGQGQRGRRIRLSYQYDSLPRQRSWRRRSPVVATGPRQRVMRKTGGRPTSVDHDRCPGVGLSRGSVGEDTGSHGGAGSRGAGGWGTGRSEGGKHPGVPDDKAQRNFTDAESRIARTWRKGLPRKRTTVRRWSALTR